jgi:hypothetical protein
MPVQEAAVEHVALSFPISFAKLIVKISLRRCGIVDVGPGAMRKRKINLKKEYF